MRTTDIKYYTAKGPTAWLSSADIILIMIVDREKVFGFTMYSVQVYD
jgi:hypothetical protein